MRTKLQFSILALVLLCLSSVSVLAVTIYSVSLGQSVGVTGTVSRNYSGQKGIAQGFSLVGTVSRIVNRPRSASASLQFSSFVSVKLTDLTSPNIVLVAGPANGSTVSGIFTLSWLLSDYGSGLLTYSLLALNGSYIESNPLPLNTYTKTVSYTWNTANYLNGCWYSFCIVAFNVPDPNYESRSVTYWFKVSGSSPPPSTSAQRLDVQLINGTVIITGATVNVQNTTWISSQLTNSSGWASFSVWSGLYSISAVYGGRVVNSTTATISSASMSIIFNILPSAPALTYLLVVKVTDQNNVPLSGAAITVKTTAGTVVGSGETNSSGLWSIRLAPAQYVVSMTRSGYVSSAPTVTLSQNGTVATPTLQISLIPQVSGYQIALGQFEVGNVQVAGSFVDNVRWELIRQSPLLLQVYFYAQDLTTIQNAYLVQSGYYYPNPTKKYELFLVRVADDGRAIFVFRSIIGGEVIVNVKPWTGQATEYGAPPETYKTTIKTEKSEKWDILLDNSPFATFDWVPVTYMNVTTAQLRTYRLDGTEWRTAYVTAKDLPILQVGGFEGVGWKLNEVTDRYAIWILYSGKPILTRPSTGVMVKPLPMIRPLQTSYLIGDVVNVRIRLPEGTTSYDVQITGGKIDTTFGQSGVLKGIPDPTTREAELQFRPLDSSIYYGVTVSTLARDGKYSSQTAIYITPPWYTNIFIWLLLGVGITIFLLAVKLRGRRQPLQIDEGEVVLNG